MVWDLFGFFHWNKIGGSLWLFNISLSGATKEGLGHKLAPLLLLVDKVLTNEVGLCVVIVVIVLEIELSTQVSVGLVLLLALLYPHQQVILLQIAAPDHFRHWSGGFPFIKPLFEGLGLQLQQVKGLGSLLFKLGRGHGLTGYQISPGVWSRLRLINPLVAEWADLRQLLVDILLIVLGFVRFFFFFWNYLEPIFEFLHFLLRLFLIRQDFLLFGPLLSHLIKHLNEFILFLELIG